MKNNLLVSLLLGEETKLNDISRLEIINQEILCTRDINLVKKAILTFQKDVQYRDGWDGKFYTKPYEKSGETYYIRTNKGTIELSSWHTVESRSYRISKLEKHRTQYEFNLDSEILTIIKTIVGWGIKYKELKTLCSDLSPLIEIDIRKVLVSARRCDLWEGYAYDRDR